MKIIKTIVNAFKEMAGKVLFPEKDKAKHQFVGMYITIVTLAFSQFISAWIALGVLITVGVGYELYQWKTGKGTPEVMDAVRTIFGGLFVLFWHLVAWEIGNNF